MGLLDIALDPKNARDWHECEVLPCPLCRCFRSMSGRNTDIVKLLRLTDTVEKVLGDPLERNNRIRTASCLNRNCVRGSYPESMLRVRARKIVFQQYRSKPVVWRLEQRVRIRIETGNLSHFVWLGVQYERGLAWTPGPSPFKKEMFERG